MKSKQTDEGFYMENLHRDIILSLQPTMQVLNEAKSRGFDIAIMFATNEANKVIIQAIQIFKILPGIID